MTATRRLLVLLALTVVAVLGAGSTAANATFSDSAALRSMSIGTGTVSIDLTQPATPIPAITTGFLPGDSIARTVTLRNDGDSPLSSVALGVTTTNPSVLTTDTVHGLQLALQSCSVAWTPATPTTYSCAGTQKTHTTGPAVGTRSLDTPASLTPGGSDHLLVTLSLPTTADNTFQGRTSTLALTFSGVQRAATTR